MPKHDDPEPEPAPVHVHPLFSEAEESAAFPLTAPIETIDVRRFEPGEPRPVMLGWHPAADLTDEMTVLTIYGPGRYELVGRPANRCGILRRQILAVGFASRGGAAAHAPAPAAPAAPAHAPAPAVDGSLALLIAEMRASREASERMMLNFAGASRDQALDMVKAVSSLANARIGDLTASLREQRTSNGDASTAMERGAELYETTLAKAIALADELRSRPGGGGSGSDVAMVNAIVDGIRAFRSDPNAPAAVAAAANGQGNGHGNGPTQ